MTRALLWLPLSALACALPADPVTGLELSWVTRENLEDSPRTRTCASARTSVVSVEISDVDDPSRDDVWSFDCEEGFQSDPVFAITPSSVFIDLRPGTYELRFESWGDDSGSQVGGHTLSTWVVRAEVTGKGVTVVRFEARPAKSEVTLNTTQTSACANMALTLVHARGDDFLPSLEPDTLVGEGLATDTGLPLDGTPVACAQIGDGAHALPTLDAAQYTLLVEVDGRRCERPLLLSADPTQLTLDLAQTDCGL